MKEIIKNSSLTIKEFAEKYEIPYNTIRQWYSGTRTPPKWLKKILNELITYKKTLKELKNENEIKRKYLAVIYHKKSDCIIRMSLLRTEEETKNYNVHWEEYTKEKGYITKFYKLIEEETL